MKPVKIVHTADLHIKEPHDEGFEALKEILNKSKEQEASIIFIAGDLFDSDGAASHSRVEARSLFESYPAIKVVLIPGNHDRQGYAKDIFYGANVSVLSEKPFQNLRLEGIEIWGVPFQTESRFATILKKISSEAKAASGYRILVTHGTLIDTWLKEILVSLKEYEDENNPFYIHGDDFTDSGIDLALLGHYHGFVEKRYGETLATYSGSAVYSNANPGPRRASLIEVDPSARPGITVLRLSSGYSLPVELKALPGQEELLLAKIDGLGSSEDLSNAVLDLRLSGYITMDENVFTKRLEEGARRLKKRYKEVKMSNKVKLLSAARENSTVKEFLDIWGKEMDDAKDDPVKGRTYMRALDLALGAFDDILLKKKTAR